MLFPAAAAQSPIQFGPYLLTECVGQGGMAVVYKATRQGPSGFAKTVVVKAMLPTLSAQREFVAMFSAEARLMAALTHPNIVQVQDFGVIDGNPYLVMEYLAGRNLSQLRNSLAAKKMKLPVGAALTIAREMSHGLGYAHDFVDGEGKRRRVIHRDVSPSNVMVCRDGSVKLLDFGVAKIVGELEFDLTHSLKGKYAYMAPEQVSHQPIDCRVDVFAAGVVLHELLTGKRLFAANTELETLQRVSRAQVIAPSVDNREVPRALDAIVKKALARNPHDRYATGAELVEALETLDALAWPRKRVATLMAELFAHEWMIVCEVCGKAVQPSTECRECGTLAPESSSPVPLADAEDVEDSGADELRGEDSRDEDSRVDELRADDLRADELRAIAASGSVPIMLAASNTERNAVGETPLPLLPTSTSEPLPLPPPPLTPVPRRAPKMLPNDEPRRRLQVVRTPLPPPLAPASSLVPPVNALSQSLASMASSQAQSSAQPHASASHASTSQSSASHAPMSSSHGPASASQSQSQSQSQSPQSQSPQSPQSQSPQSQSPQSQLSSSQSSSSSDGAPLIEDATLPPPGPPRLFVVPRAQETDSPTSPAGEPSFADDSSPHASAPSGSSGASSPHASPSSSSSSNASPSFAPSNARPSLWNGGELSSPARTRSTSSARAPLAEPHVPLSDLRAASRSARSQRLDVRGPLSDPRSPLDLLSTPRPKAPQPLFMASPSSTAVVLRPTTSTPRLLFWLAVLTAAIFGAWTLLQDAPRVEPAAPSPSTSAPSVVAAPPVVPAPSAPRVNAKNADAIAATAKTNVKDAKTNVSAKPNANLKTSANAAAVSHVNAAAHRRATHVAKPAVTDERSVKEGRLVDPFAELK